MKPTHAAVHIVLLAGGISLLSCQAPVPQDREPEARQILVDGLDYSFAMEESIQAGPAEMRFRNVGDVPHELAMVRLEAGATLGDVSAAMSSGVDPQEFVDGIVGILIADPGETSLGTLQVEFQPGRTYLMLCNFTDTPESPPHLAMGMIRAFSVPEAGS